MRTLVSDLGLSLYEISMVTEAGDPVEGQQRFSAYQLSQAILARKADCVLLFDDASDVFSGTANAFPRNGTKRQWKESLDQPAP